MSRTNRSGPLSLSPAIRSEASDSNSTSEPSPAIEGIFEVPLPAVEPGVALTRISEPPAGTGGRPHGQRARGQQAKEGVTHQPGKVTQLAGSARWRRGRAYCW